MTNIISRVKCLEKLQLKALKHIDQNAHGQGDDVLYNCYNVQPLTLRWREHILCLMYRLSHNIQNIEVKRPNVQLRSSKKVKFKKGKKRQYELYFCSPLSRGVKIWEMLTAKVQKATTRVKFKRLIHELCV